MDRLLAAIRRTNIVLHYVSGSLIVLMMLFTVYNILGRWLFDEPLQGRVELTQLSLVAIVYLGFAHTQHTDDHISVDLLYLRVGRRLRLAFDAIASLISLVVLGLMAWHLYRYSTVLQAGGRTTAAWRLPLYPVTYVAIVGVVAYMLALATTTIERGRAIGRDDGDRAAPDRGEA